MPLKPTAAMSDTKENYCTFLLVLTKHFLKLIAFCCGPGTNIVVERNKKVFSYLNKFNIFYAGLSIKMCMNNVDQSFYLTYRSLKKLVLYQLKDFMMSTKDYWFP